MIIKKENGDYIHLILFHKEFHFFVKIKTNIILFMWLWPIKIVRLPKDAKIISQRCTPKIHDVRRMIRSKKNPKGKERYFIANSYLWNTIPIANRSDMVEYLKHNGSVRPYSLSPHFALACLLSNHYGKLFNDSIKKWLSFMDGFRYITIIRYNAPKRF